MEPEVNCQPLHVQTYATPGVLIRSEAFVQPQGVECQTATASTSNKTNLLLVLFGALFILAMGFYLGLQSMSSQMALISKQNSQLQAQNQVLQQQNAQIQQQLAKTQTAISNFKKCLVKSGF